LLKRAAQEKAYVDDLIDESEGFFPVDYTYDASLPWGTYAETRTWYNHIRDSGGIAIGGFFFAGTFPGRTLAQNQTETILHEWTHAYWQTFDEDSRWFPVGAYITISSITAIGMPVYTAPGVVVNREWHADTWGWFLMNWYTP
jgi:hypothetical protein